eukprot:TRINITY_DN12912_c0_g1_i1.p1 TRINITY_DN12912_c0_g1~~TRINITY_DN12912_c0_g1_i1.p1  ORF type:complete len:369 (+),score=108.86 TRINITY_DN12912_c0_g1_i1:51-1109(+)
MSETAPTPSPSLSPETPKPDVEQKEKTSSDYYWNSYAHFSIHEEMLKDEVRTMSYRRAILDNKHLFKDKIVLDVGCGSGILSMFCSQAGAKHVYAVDMSDIIVQARQICEDNGFKDKITLIQGKIEEVVLPNGVEKVDIIVSEWMGYFLLYESMLNSVIVARDRFLAEDGILMPDQSSMFIAGLEDAAYKEEKIHFWDNVYGFDMKCIKSIAIKEPLVDSVDGASVCTTACKFFDIDLYTVTEEELSFAREFSVQATRSDYCHAFIAWFDVRFSKCHKPIYFSTSPMAKYTHWKQTVFYLEDVLTVNEGEEITGKIKVGPNEKNPRDINVLLESSFSGQNGSNESVMDYVIR